MLPIIGIVASGLFGVVGDWMKNKKEVAHARHDRDVAIIKGKQKLAEGEQSHNSAWELEALKRASKFLRWVVALTILAPIWQTMYSPTAGKVTFEILKTNVPTQWWALFLILCGFAFATRNLIELVKNFNFWKK